MKFKRFERSWQSIKQLWQLLRERQVKMGNENRKNKDLDNFGFVEYNGTR